MPAAKRADPAEVSDAAERCSDLCCEITEVLAEIGEHLDQADDSYPEAATALLREGGVFDSKTEAKKRIKEIRSDLAATLAALESALDAAKEQLDMLCQDAQEVADELQEAQP